MGSGAQASSRKSKWTNFLGRAGLSLPGGASTQDFDAGKCFRALWHARPERARPPAAPGAPALRAGRGQVMRGECAGGGRTRQAERACGGSVSAPYCGRTTQDRNALPRNRTALFCTGQQEHRLADRFHWAGSGDRSMNDAPSPARRMMVLVCRFENATNQENESGCRFRLVATAPSLFRRPSRRISRGHVAAARHRGKPGPH